MAVSVRMDPLMEKELELAAKRKGVTKSQFIIEAVERALGRKDPAALYQLVMGGNGAASYSVAEPDALQVQQVHQSLRGRLKSKHDAQASDWLAYQQAKQRGEPWPSADEGPAA